MNRTLRLLLCPVLLFAGSLSAANLQKITADARDALRSAQISRSAGAGTFSDFVVSPADSIAGHSTRYAVSFTVSEDKWLASHLDGFAFVFPDGFDLSRLTLGPLSDDNPCVSFDITDVQITGQIVAVQLRRHWDAEGDCRKASSIGFSLTFAGVGNPEQSGSYHLSGLAFDVSDDILAGPALSNSFHIVPGAVTGITVRPSDDSTLAAGGFIIFTAFLTDEFGNPIESITPTWSLTPGSDSIGTVYNDSGENGMFQATTVGTGRVMATYNGQTATSGLITVTPGALARIDLVVANRQLVGQPLVGPSSVTLYDNYDNRKTDLDLAATPLILWVDEGALTPDTIRDNGSLADGVIDLAALGIVYHGPTTVTQIRASVGHILSRPADVSFSGYDILAVLNLAGQPLSTVLAGIRTPVNVVIQNNGLTAPSGPLAVSAQFDATPGADTVSLTGSSNGVIDTVLLSLPVHPETPSSDGVTFVLNAPFSLAGQDYTTNDTAHIDVTVQPAAQLQLVSDSIGPDTVYPGRPFFVSFAVDADGIADTAMSGAVTVAIVSPGSTDGRIVYHSLLTNIQPSPDGIISYSSLSAVLPVADALPSGDFVYQVSFVLNAGGTSYPLVTEVNPVTVLKEVMLTYVPGTFAPTSAVAGAPTAFQFQVNLGNDYAVPFDGQNSALTLTGPGFTTSSNLIGPDTLYPGPVTLRTQPLVVPSGLLGDSLTVAGRFDVTAPLDYPVTVTTDFDSLTLPVTAEPVAQIVGLQIIAPNAPKVNTLQPFQARCLVANLSGTEVAPTDVYLESDGSSTFDKIKTTPAIPPYDTVAVLFNCVAASEPNPAEIFRASLSATDLTALDPINNIAPVTIQTPADLKFSYTLFGAPDGLVDQSTGFGLTVELTNSGEAATSDGTYLLTTDGIDFGVDDSLTGSITVGHRVEFQFVSPPIDTVANFVFRLTDIPLDANTAQPAMIDSTSVTIPIRVESQQADLLVEAVPLGSNLVSPDQTKDLFRLNLTNRGVSTISMIDLKDFAVALRGHDNQPLSVASYIEPAGTSVSEDGTEIPATISAKDKLLVEFSNFLIPSGATRSIVLTAAFTHTVSGEFTLSLETDDIHAVFSGGSQDGRPVRISSASGSSFLLSRSYVVRGHSLHESFVIENNPFNPERQPAHFSYELLQPSTVEFRVFTLTGEEVYARDIPESAGSGTGSEREVLWDGRNGAGDMVANGVYIVSLKIVRTGEQALMKVAVVK